jgi:dTDP-4-amino-4,6-dideoxygalactose transaminase
MINLEPLLRDTEEAWRVHLDSMHRQMRYVLGEQVASFEQEFAAAHLARYGIGVGSGTAALQLSLMDAGITNPAQEVILPALTSPFTAHAVVSAGATPVFADVQADTLLLDPKDVAARVTSRTSAIICVHLYGQLCDLPELSAIASRRGVLLIQDACQAHGASWHGKSLCDFSDYVAYSFYPTKNLGALGDGGAVLTNRSDVSDRLRMMRDGGRLPNQQVSRMRALNSRLDEMHACYLRASLPHLPNWNAQRARAAERYDALLARAEFGFVRRRNPGVHHLYVTRTGARDDLREKLNEAGIASGIHYPLPLHLHPAFETGAQPEGSLPCSEQACRQIVSLPLWPYISDAQLDYVSHHVCRFWLAEMPSA